MTDDPLLGYLTPIIRGQVRSYLNDHPEVLSADTRQNRRKVEFGLSKRILGEFKPGAHTRGVTRLILAFQSGIGADSVAVGLPDGDQWASTGIGPAGGAIGRARPAADALDALYGPGPINALAGLTILERLKG